MTANNIKEWTASNGDFRHCAEVDYERNYFRERKGNESFQKIVEIFIAVTGISAVVLILELLTRV